MHGIVIEIRREDIEKWGFSCGNVLKSVILCCMNYRITAPSAIEVTIALPASKSISARALVISALCRDECKLRNIAICDDTHALMQGLATMHGIMNVGAAGTAMRFLTAFHACQQGHDVTIDGCERMHERPISPLVEALKQLGAKIEYKGREGFPPLHIKGSTLQGAQKVTMCGDVSSQFVTALMLIAPTIGGLEIELMGEIVSAPYIDMTIAVMYHYGIDSQWNGNVISVPAGEFVSMPMEVEADWSSASYWLALQALLPHSRISLKGLHQDSWQGDSRILTFMQQLGMCTQWADDGTLHLDMSNTALCCCSTYADLNGTPDLAPTLIVLLCLLGRPFRLTGLRTLAIKESDRLEALRIELEKLGYLIQLEGSDAVSWHFQTCAPQSEIYLDSHGDHRLAMSLALATTRYPEIVITDVNVVEKSYPTFWKQLSKVGFSIKQI